MTLGLIGIALSMWYSTTLTPDASITAALMIPLVLVLVRRVNIGSTSAPIGH
jgi:hypothetical protein